MRNTWILTSLLFSFLTLACQETKVESSKPSSTSSGNRDKVPSEDEKVIPPVPVNGVWLNAQVLKEKTNNNGAEIQIGIASYYNGVKVTDQRDRFMLNLTVTPVANNGVTVSQEAAPTGDYDHVVTIQGSNLERVRGSYATIGLFMTILDRNDNSSDTWNTPLEAVLNDSPSKTAVHSSSSVSVSTGASAKGP